MKIARRHRRARHAADVRPGGAFVAGLGIADLVKALDEDRVSIVLQPQVELATGETIGFETLARVVGEDGELISPARFLPLAERTGLIRPLGRRLFALSCAAAASLETVGRSDLRVAINVSPIQAGDELEVGVLLDILRGSGVDPRRIEIELTESARIADFRRVGQQLQRFRALGVSVAIDDFGTGYCSLAWLLELPVDRIKIDRRFVQALGQGKTKLASAVIDLGQRLELDVVAEGVETEAEARWLRNHQCPSAQGFLYARPMPLDGILARLRSEGPPRRAQGATISFPLSQMGSLTGTAPQALPC